MSIYPIKQAKAALEALARLKTETTLPLAANILVTAEGINARWSRWSTDGRLEVLLACDAPPAAPLTIPCDTLHEIVALAMGDDLRVEAECGGLVTVAHDGGTYELATLPADDYPQALPCGDLAGGFSLTGAALAHALKRVLWAVPAKDHRRILVGVHFAVHNDGIRLTGTDGKQLARVCADATLEPFPAFVLPYPVAQLVASMLAGADDECNVEVRDEGKAVELSCGVVTLSCQTIEGRYPDVDAVLPKGKPLATLRGGHEALARALKRANVTSDDKNHGAVLTVSRGLLSIESSAADVGRATIQAHGVECEGSAVVAVNAPMMAKALAESEPGEVHIHEGQRAVILRGETVEALVMPIKLADVRAGEVEA